MLFSYLCVSLLFTVLVSGNYVVTPDQRLVSLFHSVTICYVICVAGTGYSPCSSCRCCVVSFHVVCFVHITPLYGYYVGRVAQSV